MFTILLPGLGVGMIFPRSRRLINEPRMVYQDLVVAPAMTIASRFMVSIQVWLSWGGDRR